MGQVVGGFMIFWKLPDSFPIELHLRISANLGSATRTMREMDWGVVKGPTHMMFY